MTNGETTALSTAVRKIAKRLKKICFDVTKLLIDLTIILCLKTIWPVTYIWPNKMLKSLRHFGAWVAKIWEDTQNTEASTTANQARENTQPTGFH